MNSAIIRVNNYKVAFFCLLFCICTIVYGQDAAFIWSEEDQNGSRILLSTYADGVWQPGEKIIDDANLNILPAMAINSQNHTLAVWSLVSGSGSILKYSIKRGAGWQAARILASQMSTNLAPVIVFDHNDTGWVFWSANNGDDDDIYVSKFIDDSWTPAEMVHIDNGVPDILAEAGRDGAGNIWVTWQQLKNNGYIELSQTFETETMRKFASTESLDTDNIRQMKKRAARANSISPPAFFRARSRATIYFPGNTIRPSMPVKGNLD